MLRNSRICSIEYINGLLDHGLLLGLGDDDHGQYWADTTIGTRTKNYATTGTVATGAITATNVTASDNFIASLGAEGTPSYTFTGLGDTGMYTPDANSLGFTINGSQVLVINPTETVIVGNLEPFNDDTSYLGHQSWRWKGLFLSGDASIDGDISCVDITASGTITDETASLVGGSLTGLTNLTVDNININGYNYTGDGIARIDFGSAKGPDDTKGADTAFSTGDGGDLTASGVGKIGGFYGATSGSGGISSIGGGANTGGVGGNVLLQAGTGGVATNGSSNTGGVGGQGTLRGGMGASQTSGTAGVGGKILLAGGAGGSPPIFTVGVAGGDVEIVGGIGSANASTQGPGGDIIIDGGAGNAGVTDGCIYLGATLGNVRIGSATAPTNALSMDTASKIDFRDNAIGIYSQADTFLDLFADGAVRIGDSSAGAPTNYTEFEPDGTIKFNGDATVFNDIVVPLSSARVPASNAPNWESFIGNLNAYTYGLNDFQEFSTELAHSYKSGSTIQFHVHGAVNGTDGTERKIKVEIEYTIADVPAENGFGDVYPATTTIDGELTIPASTTDLTAFSIDVGDDTTGNFVQGAIVKGRVRRIASTGTEPASNPFFTEVGIHIESDTIGTRTATSK